MSEELPTAESDAGQLRAEVEHWKAHAEEAGRGFTQVCRDYARVAARNVEAVGLLNDLVTAKKLRLDAEEWQVVWDRVFRFLDTSVIPPASTDEDQR